MRIRLTHFLIFSFVIFITALAQSQLQKPIELKAGSYRATELLNILEEKDVNLAYSPDVLPVTPVEISSGSHTVRTILKALRTQTGVQYRTNKDVILISYQRKMFTLSGTITDKETGEALIGAAVVIGEGLSGTITNTYGFYSITLPEGNYPVSYRFLGYEPIRKEIILSVNTIRGFLSTWK